MTIGSAGQEEKRNKKSLSWRSIASGLVLVCVLAYLVFAQGGYYGTTMCLAGVILWTGFVIVVPEFLGRFNRASLVVPFLVFALAVWYLVATLAVSPTATSALEAGTWFAVAGAAFLALVQTKEARSITLKFVAGLGLVTAFFGLVVFSGLLVFDDALYQGRLQSTFQYANTAAVWFGVSGILCFASSQKLRAFSPVCFVAMLLCRSAGALVSFVLVLVVCALVARVQGVKLGGLAGGILFVIAASFLGAALVVLVPSSLRVVAVLLLVVLCLLKAVGFLRMPTVLASRADVFEVPHRKLRNLGSIVAVAIVVLVVLALAFGWGRVQQATGTFAMRLVYNTDALSALMTSPLFGLGPDMWRFFYPQFQSAQYSAALVHCGYLQLAVDAGLPGLFLFVAAIGIGIRNLLQAGSSHWGELACVLLIAIHSLVDFDLSFGAIALLLAYLLVLPCNKNDECTTKADASAVPSKKNRRCVWAYRALAALCIASGLAACFWSSNVYSNVQSLGETRSMGEYSQAVQEFEDHQDGSLGGRLVVNDPVAQEVFLDSCLESASFGKMNRFCADRGVSTSAQALSAFEGLYLAGDKDLAMDVLIGQLEKEPYNYQFYKKAKRLAHRFDLQGKDLARFEAAVSSANQAAQNQNPLYPKAPKLIRI